ncbi:MAG: hypothetical protein K0R51_789 [Cytophagaceae bacterium]|jgi:hypothetical protein|nr:hypothetical protein [Cytophagaceae bacterium]
MKNIKKSIIFSLFVLYAFTSGKVFAQGEANVWIGATRVGLNFNSGSPTSFETGAARGVIDAGSAEGEGTSSIANAAGNLLFYTQGVNVYDRTHAVMSNGTGLLGNISSTQSAVIVPCPANPTRFYYIFCAPPEEASAFAAGSTSSSDGITYSIVDMNGNGGLGAVTTKNVRITPVGENATEGLTAVPNLDGDGFWVIAHRAGDKPTTTPAYNKFYIYGVTTAGINAATGVITSFNNQSANAGTGIAGVVPGTLPSGSGNGQVIIKSNSCFNKLAMTFFAKNSLVEIYNFNNDTGAISLANSITNVINNQVYGLEFSPNGDYLYVTVLETNHRLYQFDISSGVNATINAARTEWTPTGTTSLRWGQLQLGPDGKIYMAHHVDWNSIGAGSPHASIGVINNPNVGGTGANFVEQQITSTTLTGTGSKHGLPQIYKGFVAGQLDFGDDLPTVAGVKIICQNTSVNFTINFTGVMKPNTLDVDWGDGVVQTNIPGTPTSVSHTYTTTGPKTVNITFEDDCNNPYNLTTPLNVVAAPTGTITCIAPDKLRFDVTSTTSATSTYIWYKTATGADAWGTGTSFTTPSLTAPFPSDVYLLEANGSGGTVTTLNPTAPTDAFGSTVLNRITVTKQLFMQSFDVVPYTNSTCTGTVTATVRNAASAIVATVTVNSPSTCGALTMPINVSLAPGNYTITMSSTGTIAGFNYMQNWHASVPYVATDLMSDYGVSGSAGGDAGPAFNFKLINSLASCNRVHITATCSLPVTWLDFTGLRSDQSVVLNWSTATEENNKVFHVQRSIDGVNFVTIDDVLTAGNGNVVRYYEYTDVNAPSGSVYYRLVQEDINGASSNSKIVIVGPAGKLDLALVPNPGNGSFTITGLAADVKLNVAVYSITGQSVFTTLASPGQIIDLEGIAKGFYIVKIVSGTTEQSIRYINQ